MNYIHVFLHIKSVASRASVYLMAAVIGAETQQSFMPAPFRFYSVVYLQNTAIFDLSASIDSLPSGAQRCIVPS